MTTTSPDDTPAQESFLRDFHARRPAVTVESFGAGRSADGRSSYRILADLVAQVPRVLELGCGDGHLLELLASDGRGPTGLAGIDLSPEALALAAGRPALAGARLREGRAQSLPFADGSFDACVSHMALMLMADVEEVAAEAARVLVPGGLLACVLGGGPAGGEAYEMFVGLLREWDARLPGGLGTPRLGDRRTRDRAGLQEILSPAGFGPVGWSTVRIDIGGPAEQVWDAVSGVYDLGPMPEAAVTRLREEFLTGAARLRGPDGTTPCALRLHLATARLAPADAGGPAHPAG
ncbi:class I SAM-dependent methyltransferase [Streptomyces fuscigenes]|uniref:class I SAM-dependent methyltransferase n=1 Tax=Streptomyces fuscigenes TaxID=1528880 RepID=UPI001F40E356|nr:class I SAM-dependent methyltransferase [Streptomyces fuscigenes]MCF3964667.1 class I SAM-dependent methyltransferase [Streptomyces fuscigenes]